LFLVQQYFLQNLAFFFINRTANGAAQFQNEILGKNNTYFLKN